MRLNHLLKSSMLIIYYDPASFSAPTVVENIRSFKKYSKHDVYELNICYGFPKSLSFANFSIIVLHYSLFGRFPFLLSESFSRYVESATESLKIAFFQDEMQFCQERFEIINKLNIHIVYSCLDPKYFDEVYFQNTSVREVNQYLTGYVSDSLIRKSLKLAKDSRMRSVDVGYRARDLPYYFGKGAREKSEIAQRFSEACIGENFILDISTKDDDRIYAEEWYEFIANCKFTLGVLSGTSIFDLTGEIKRKVEEYILAVPHATFEELEKDVLLPYEGRIDYRAISPRIFESAAFRTCMILYSDDYQGILVEDEHYIGLKKDFSNVTEVFEKMKNSEYVTKIVNKAHLDIIESGKYHYRDFIRKFDDNLCTMNVNMSATNSALNMIIFNFDLLLRRVIFSIRRLQYVNFPGRNLLIKFVKM
jgi:hypothetical protein